MAVQRTQSNFKRNSQGTAKPFIAGLENPRLTALDQFTWQAFTEVSGLNVETTDNTTITMPSDTDGFQLVEIITGYGQLQAQTATLTEYMDETQNTSWLKGVKRSLPFSLWLPQGRGRNLSDPNDFTSGTLVDLANIQSEAQDDNFNQSEGEPGNPNKISATMSYHGRNRHTIRAAEFTSGPTATGAFGGAAYLTQRETNGATSVQWFLIEKGGTSARPKVHIRDAFGNWADGVDFGANADVPGRAKVVSGNLLAVGGAAGTSHWFIDPDNISSATEVTSALFDANTKAQDVYVKSANEIFIVGGAGFNSTDKGAAGALAAGQGKIVKVSDPLQAGTLVGSAGANATSYNAIDGFVDQVVVVGGSGVVDDTLGTGAIVLVSNNSGVSFSSVTAPTGAKELTSVFMSEEDTFWVASGDGNMWFTYNFGKTWTQRVLATSMSSISDITFLWPTGKEEAGRVGYIVGTAGSSGNTVAAVQRTIDGGYSWHSGGSYISEEITGTGHAATHWNQIVVAAPQSVLLAGSQGATANTDLSAITNMDFE